MQVRHRIAVDERVDVLGTEGLPLQSSDLVGHSTDGGSLFVCQVTQRRSMPFRLDHEIPPVRGGAVECMDVADVDEVVFEEDAALGGVALPVLLTEEAVHIVSLASRQASARDRTAAPNDALEAQPHLTERRIFAGYVGRGSAAGTIPCGSLAEMWPSSRASCEPQRVAGCLTAGYGAAARFGVADRGSGGGGVARILFSTIGSWGDLFPVIGTALELQRRGHEVELTASPAWGDLVAEAGLRFSPAGRTIGFEEFTANPEIFGRMPFALRTVLQRFMFDQIDELTEDLRGPMARSDLVVSHPAHIAALNVAEQARTPSAVATVFPAMIPSSHRVHGGARLGPWTGPFGRALNRSMWATASVAGAAMFDRPINAHRRSLGLAPVRNAILELQLRTRAVVVMVDRAVIQPPPDWPEHVHVASFVDWDRIGTPALTARVQDFLREGRPPVLVTLGTSTSTVAGDFFEHATRQLLERDLRVLTVTGPAPPVADIAPGRALSVDYVPYSAVLAGSQAVIHHAGIGTTLAALRAGLPHLALPMSHDQPDTARLIERLGVGLQIPWKRHRQHLGRAVDQLIDDDRFSDNAARIAEDLHGRDGAHLAGDAIERVLQDAGD
jgi:rhamnosyltransferase subunit B